MNSLTKCTLWNYLLLSSAATVAWNAWEARGAYPDLILADHPIAYYRLEETSGPTANDSAGSGINGTYMFNGAGTSPQLGQPGIATNSIAFAGGLNSDCGYADIPFNSLFCPTLADGIHGAAFSAECWVQANAQPPANYYEVPLAVFGPYGSGIYGNASGWNFYQSPGPNSTWMLNMRNIILAPSAPIKLLEWYHLAVTFDGTVTTFYVNGASQGAWGGGAAYLANPSTDITIGYSPTTGQNPFNGSVDEVAFYTNALTPDHILARYQLGTNSFRAVPTPPAILTDPASTTNFSGTPATFSVTANGTLPLYYQWWRGSAPLPGATANALTFTCSYAADNNASFKVVITNSYGAKTSAVATLTVATNLIIAQAPAAITRAVGSYAAFRPVVYGALPIRYQWYKGASLLPNQTNATLWLSNVQLADSGSPLSVVVSNPFTSATLAADLTVQPRAVNVPLTGYAQIIAAEHPVAYWRLNEPNGSTSAIDAVGSFDGAYTDTSGGTGVFAFQVPDGIPHWTNDPGVGLTGGAVVSIPYALELNPDTAWSAETWIKPSSLAADAGDYRVVLSSQYNRYPNPYNGWYVYQQPSATFAFVPQPGNQFIVAGPNDPAHTNLIVAGNWYHLVITDDGNRFNVYINGELRTGFPVPGSGFVPNGDGINADGTVGGGATVLGRRTDNAFNSFLGSIDETAFYNYALTPKQVQAHYQGSVWLDIAQSDTNVVLTWPVGTLQSASSVTGPYNNVDSANSPYHHVASPSMTFYRVKLLSP